MMSFLDGGPGRFKVSRKCLGEEHGCTPANFSDDRDDYYYAAPGRASFEERKSHQCRSIFDREIERDGRETMELPPGSLLLKSPRKLTSNEAERLIQEQTDERPLADHYRSLLFEGSRGSLEDELKHEAQSFFYGDLGIQKVDLVERQRPTSGLLGKYRAQIVPRGMSRPLKTETDDSCTESAGETVEERQVIAAPGPEGQYFQFVVPPDVPEYDEEPSLGSEDEQPSDGDDSEEDFDSNQVHSEFEDAVHADVDCDSEVEDITGDDLNEDSEQLPEPPVVDGPPPQQHKYIGKEDYPDEERLSDGEEENKANDREIVSSKYVEIIARLTNELSKAQEHIHNLEKENEEEKKELEIELEETDKGNLDLRGEVVGLQRRVMDLASERQDFLLQIQSLKKENELLTKNYNHVEEVAQMLQTKTYLLEQQLVRGKRPGKNQRKISNLPQNLEQALDRIEDLEALNLALQANIDQIKTR